MEYIRKCNVCGKIYCYSSDDLKENASNAAVGALSAIGAIASVFEGTRWDTYALNSQSDRYTNRVVNYNKCPSCNSTNTVLLSEQECKEMQQDNIAEITTQNVQTRKIEINSNATTDSLLKRIKMFLEESDWESASAYAEQVLDIDPECAMAYVYKLMINLNVTKQEDLSLCNETFYEDKMYQKAIRFADESLLKTLEGYNYTITERNNNDRYTQAINQFNSATTEEECLSLIPLFQNLGKYRYSEEMLSKCKEKANLCKYKKAMNLMSIAKSEEEYLYIKGQFDLLGDYEDSKANSLICKDKAEEARKNAIYEEAVSCVSTNSISALEDAINCFDKIPGWRDANLKKNEALERIEKLKQTEKNAKKRKKTIVLFSMVALIAGISFVIITKQIVKSKMYNSASNAYSDGEYITAIKLWTELNDYKDSKERLYECVLLQCEDVKKYINNGDYDNASEMLAQIEKYVKEKDNKAYDVVMGYDTLIDVFDEIRSGGSINITEIYAKIQNLPSDVDCSPFYDLKIIKETEDLGTTWKIKSAMCNKSENKYYEEDYYGYSFEDGRFILLDENRNEEFSSDLYYYKGVFSAGPNVGGKDYTIITGYNGLGDKNIYVKDYFISDGEKYEWIILLSRE